MSGPEFRSGFVCLVGRPNTGKSTLTNALVGSKVAITSNRPQTTRHTIRGIVHRENFQIVLVDTPGLHRPRTLLGKRLNDLVRDTYSEVDVIGLCIPADETIGPGDTLPLTVQVVERLPRRIGVGAEIGTTEGLGVSAFWLHRNLLGGAERFRVEGEIAGLAGETGGSDYKLGIRYERPAT